MNNELINDYDLLIKKIASKFYNASFEDLYQAGCIGLLKAKRNYKESKNAKFSTYAYEYIYGEMYNYVNSEKSLKVSKDNLKLYKKIIKVRDLLTQKLDKNPSYEEIANYLNIPRNLIDDAILSAEQVLSIDGNIDYNIIDKVTMSNGDLTNQILIKDSLEVLDTCEKEIIKYRYFLDKTQSETAKELDINQVKVSRYEQKSLQKIKKYIYS